MSYFTRLYNSVLNRDVTQATTKAAVAKPKPDVVSTLPNTRKSSPDTTYNLQSFKEGVNLVTPSFVRECIPIIRRLYKDNPELGIALFDIIQLTNTGYDISFDASVTPDQADIMREHIEARTKEWNYGTAGLPGIINKMIAQLYVSGAVSTEWVPNRKLTGLESVIFVNPESIEFSLDKRKTTYKPYQRVKRSFVASKDK